MNTANPIVSSHGRSLTNPISMEEPFKRSVLLFHCPYRNMTTLTCYCKEAWWFCEYFSYFSFDM